MRIGGDVHFFSIPVFARDSIVSRGIFSTSNWDCVPTVFLTTEQNKNINLRHSSLTTCYLLATGGTLCCLRRNKIVCSSALWSVVINFVLKAVNFTICDFLASAYEFEGTIVKQFSLDAFRITFLSQASLHLDLFQYDCLITMLSFVWASRKFSSFRISVKSSFFKGNIQE
jgi:hypothetical protein